MLCAAGAWSRAQLIIVSSTRRARSEKGAQLACGKQQTHGAHTWFMTAEHGQGQAENTVFYVLCTSLTTTFGLHLETLT